jgi:serine/threonine-protein kinase SRPK3
MINASDYSVEVPAEDIAQYRRGGYHPVHLGDCFKDGQYKIIHKLGFGSFSTVWLARDLQYVPVPPVPSSDVLTIGRARRNVSLKVVVAEKSGELGHELRILEHLKQTDSHPGRKHVLQLLDSFSVNGPNGRHLCLVFDALGQKVSCVAERCPDYRLDGCLGRDISAQVLLAVNYLHSSEIVHGGEPRLHLRN